MSRSLQISSVVHVDFIPPVFNDFNWIVAESLEDQVTWIQSLFVGPFMALKLYECQK